MLAKLKFEDYSKLEIAQLSLYQWNSGFYAANTPMEFMVAECGTWRMEELFDLVELGLASHVSIDHIDLLCQMLCEDEVLFVVFSLTDAGRALFRTDPNAKVN